MHLSCFIRDFKHMTFRSVILILIAMCLSTLVYAECTLTLECGGGYGTRTMNFSDRQSCEAKLSETQSWLQSVGGGCDITDACSCDQSSEPTYTPPIHDYEAERLRGEERRREAKEERKQKEQETKEAFERDKQSALKTMKGAGDDAVSIKGIPSEPLKLKGLPAEMPKFKEASASSWISAKRDNKNPCPGSLAAFTYFCGGGNEWPYVCCPKGAPYLNHCDCQCYSSSKFDCKSYSKCEPR